ncbi:uncharacterized protein LOC122386344 [Amphibalanus amphitrite]|uniref:uncharacterized protein LOC122386344 n=1 Tax=Amphibalanus amphitrite TaxID=1232801 RepID=UPI001C90A0E8|nr:uncharacterized protein LOC122386344 [Amphibalanus amphitrite]
MKSRAVLLLLATAAITLPGAADGKVAAVANGLKTALDIIGKLVGIGSTLSSLTDGNKHQELLRHFDNISRDLKNDVNLVMTALRDLESVGLRVSWELTVETLEELLMDVNSNYDRFLLYQRNASTVENSTLLDFATNAVSHAPRSLQTTMYRLRDVVLETRTPLWSSRAAPFVTKGGGRTTIRNGRQRRYTIKQSLFRQFQSVVEASRGTVCRLGTSPQQMVYHLYHMVTTVLARDYVMTQFAYMLLRLFDKGSFLVEAQHFTDNYKATSAKLAEEVSLALRHLDSLFWRCDPAPHRRGATFEEVTALLQGYLENEWYLKRKSDWSRSWICNTVCSDFDITSSKDSYGRIYGRKDSALGSCIGTSEVWGFQHEFVHCSTCFCLCDEDTDSARYFSLLPATADVAQNKIVTGVRLVKLDNVFYIQLEQAEAAADGYVNSSTTQWQPIERRIDTNRDEEGRDYVRLSYSQRSVLLQELRGQENQVLTGAAFHMVGGHLTVRAQVTNISETGALVASSSGWLEGRRPAAGVPRLKLRSGPVPSTHSAAPSWPDSRPGMHTVQFEASNLDADAAQSTLPFLDTQPVAPRPAGWLSGLGLYHKGNTAGGYGGYLGLSVRGPTFG